MRRTDVLPRILLISSLFQPHAGGAERQARALAGALRRRGVEVLILTRSERGLPAVDTVDGVPVCRWLGALPLGPLWGLTYMLATLQALLRLRNRYDIVHCQQLYLHTPMAVLCQRWFRKPVVVRLACTGRYGDIQVMRRMRGSGALLALAKRARAFVALSRDAAAEAAALGVPPAHIAVVPNGVLLEDGPAPSQAREREILFVGALREQKNLGCLLEAFARLGDDLRLILVGAGPERSALEARARALGIGERTDFVGQVEDPSPFYRRARLFVLPSLAEGISNSLLEAMGFGVPVVATRIGGNVDVVEDGVNGLLVESGDPEKLANAMARLLGDEPLAASLAAAGRRVIVERFGMDRMVDRYLGVYRSLAAAEGR